MFANTGLLQIGKENTNWWTEAYINYLLLFPIALR